ASPGPKVVADGSCGKAGGLGEGGLRVMAPQGESGFRRTE
ncbi:unnamed protein product, partial [marine sediment metagenome]